MPDTSMWTEERLEKLKELWDKGLSITKIGEQLGVSRNAVAGKVYRHGLPKRQSPISTKPEQKSPEQKSTAADTIPSVEQIKKEDLPLKLALRQIDWSRKKCLWPTGDPKTSAFDFCGKDVVPGKAYCSEHCFEAYTTNRDGSES